MARYRRWNPEVDTPNLRRLFEEGTVDPTQTIGTEYMNQVFANHSDLFDHIENVRNFHNAFRRISAEWLTEQGMNGARREANTNNSTGVGGARRNVEPPNNDGENGAADDGANYGKSRIVVI